MTDWHFVRDCHDVTERLVRLNDQLDDGERTLDLAEGSALVVTIMAMREVQESLESGDDDGNPFRHDDDHKFK